MEVRLPKQSLGSEWGVNEGGGGSFFLQKGFKSQESARYRVAAHQMSVEAAVMWGAAGRGGGAR